MTKRFLGWDCANKTLAWSHVDIDTHIYSKLGILCDDLADLLADYVGAGAVGSLPGGLSPLHRDALRDSLADPEFIGRLAFIVDAMNYFVEGFMSFLSADVVDVLCGRKVADCDEIARTHALSGFLRGCRVSAESLDLIPGPRTKVIIEHQPSKVGTKTNNKSTMVGHQLMMYYVDSGPALVSPKLKNNITLADDLGYEIFLREELPRHKEKKAAVYAARKAHSKANFVFLLSVFDLDHVLDGVPRGCLDDLADSTMQILAWLVENGQFI